MSTVVEYASHHFGRSTMFDSMARSLNGWHHEGSSPRHGVHYSREQQLSQQLRLPSMATIISNAAQAHSPSGGMDAYPSQAAYYPEYGTPSPVQRTSPQLAATTSDPHYAARRLDDRLSPAQSTASDRSSDEFQEIMRMRHISRDQTQGHLPRSYQSQRQLKDTSQPDTLPEVLTAKSSPGYAAPSVAPPNPYGSQSPPTTHQSSSPRSESKSMSILNLLSDEPKGNGAVKMPAGMRESPSVGSSKYRITVRQQPFAARSCGFGERDRRVIDPPPIVQLTIDDPGQSPEEVRRRLRHPFSVVHCSIWDESGTKDMSSMPEDFRQQRRLMGTLVASPFVGLDENGDEGCFFCFPDLSCRTPGSFSLKFALVVLDPTQMRPGMKSQIVATAMSEVFQVFNAKDFPGMKASTPLTKRLKEQGCLISIKKGNEKTSAAHGRDESADDDDDDDGETKGKSRKRQKRNA
ncbi:hypothetical protein VTK73DRAFT_4178 [Phialemonium thermophilum]|uniref:Velvet domain-containing protein n=1 Tax=Phialemonium thermophilum TaxID=223376 RepID=A0ABR3XZG4_9PEZI